MEKLLEEGTRQLIVGLGNGDEVLLELVEDSDRLEIKVTMTNGQTVGGCFWREKLEPRACTNEPKVRKLIKFVHDRNRPAFSRAMEMFRPYMPSWIVRMNGHTMMGLYVGLVAVAYGTYYAFGFRSLPFLLPLVLVVVAITLGFDEDSVDEGLDFNNLEVAAHAMLGVIQAGDKRAMASEALRD